MPETHLPTEDVEQEYLRHDASALSSLASSYDGDIRQNELAASRALATAQLATASALVLVANAIREGWEDPEPEEPEGDVVGLRPVDGRFGHSRGPVGP